jgi:hypothetical protein
VAVSKDGQATVLGLNTERSIPLLLSSASPLPPAGRPYWGSVLPKKAVRSPLLASWPEQRFRCERTVVVNGRPAGATRPHAGAIPPHAGEWPLRPVDPRINIGVFRAQTGHAQMLPEPFAHRAPFTPSGANAASASPSLARQAVRPEPLGRLPRVSVRVPRYGSGRVRRCSAPGPNWRRRSRSPHSGGSAPRGRPTVRPGCGD